MRRLAIDRSTDVQSVAWTEGDSVVRAARFDGLDSRSGEWTSAVLDFLGAAVPDEIVVGTGPGSFAGIRAALAFAQGCVMGWRERGFSCRVVGLPSACAFAAAVRDVAVVGDARQGKIWIAPLRGANLIREVFQTDADHLAEDVRAAFGTDGFTVVTPDAKRIGPLLQTTFGTGFAGGDVPTAEGLARTALANPALLKPEPLPLYLNPAVRT